MKAAEFWQQYPQPADDELVERVVDLALAEDLGDEGDITSAALIPEDVLARGRILSGGEAVFCGGFLLGKVLGRLDSDCEVKLQVREGEEVGAGQVVAELRARARALLAAERTMLNFLQLLSGVASETRKIVQRLPSGGPLVVDTRKTLPGLRRLQKWAVCCGGGANHRLRLAGAVMIKDNHKLLWRKLTGRSLAEAVQEARRRVPGVPVEVEVESREELLDVVEARPEVVMLDNMAPEQIQECIRLCPKGILIEVSGGIGPEDVAAYALPGVDAISLGALTHSVRAADFSLEVGEAAGPHGEG